MHDVAFRPAAPADVPRVVARVQSAYRGDAARRGWTHEADLLDGQRTDEELVAEVLARPRSVVLLAERGGDLVGCVHVEAHGVIAHLGMLAVDPERQAAGLGRRLVAEAEARARAWSASEVRLEVIHSRAELIGWYERLGYRRTGGTSAFPSHEPRFGRPRAADLHFVILSKPLDASR